MSAWFLVFAAPAAGAFCGWWGFRVGYDVAKSECAAASDSDDERTG